MQFVCKYAKPNGEVVSSVQAGQSEEEVRHRLHDQGLLAISIKPKGWALGFTRKQRQAKIKPEAFIVFNQQFAALIKAGLPILRSLDLLKSQIKHPVLKAHISQVRDRVHSGAMLSHAMQAEGIFPTVYTASILAGERSGDLVEVINRHVKYEKTVLSVRNRFLNSLIYPAFLVGLAILMVAVVLTYVIPQFARLYEDLNVVLPRPTQILLSLSAAIQENLLVVIPFLIGLVLALRIWIGTESGRHMLDRLKLRAPILGNLWTMFSMAQLSRTLAMLLQGGTPLLTALEVARESSGNTVIADSLAYAIGQVRQGKPLSDSLETTGHFPELSIEMMRVGEQTGALPEMLNHVADFYDEDVNIRSTALLSYVEPIILIFVALFVGLILVALYAPIFSLGSQIRT